MIWWAKLNIGFVFRDNGSLHYIDVRITVPAYELGARGYTFIREWSRACYFAAGNFDNPEMMRMNLAQLLAHMRIEIRQRGWVVPSDIPPRARAELLRPLRVSRADEDGLHSYTGDHEGLHE